jgi:hypothetical protein
MWTGEKRSYDKSTARFVGALMLLVCGFAASAVAQQAGQRAARSLTSEDLLNRPAVYIPPAASTTPAVSPSGATASKVLRTTGATLYHDPAGAFTLSFPNSNWKINNRAGKIYNQRSFRRIEAEGFASATASVYVLTDRANLPLIDPARMGNDGQRELAAMLAARFLSSNASVVSVEPVVSRSRTGLRIIADQAIARRVMVRASINVFEQQGRLYVIVCCSPIETFDSAQGEFDAITNSLASSVARS